MIHAGGIAALLWADVVERSEPESLLRELTVCTDAGEAEACLVRAFDAARSLGAAGPALQVGIQLAQLWHARGRSDEARTLLAPLHAAFTEGFETADLRAARTLLTSL